MEQYALYLVLKAWMTSLNDTISYTFNDVDIKKEMSCAIRVTGSTPGNTRELSTGLYYKNMVKVQLVFISSMEQEKYLRMLKFIDEVHENMCIMNNKSYTELLGHTVYITANGKLTTVQSDGWLLLKKLNFVKTNSLSGPINAGKTQQGIPTYSLNYSMQLFAEMEEQ